MKISLWKCHIIVYWFWFWYSGREFNYVWPCGFFYIMTIIPIIWVLELGLLDKRQQLSGSTTNSSTSSSSSFTRLIPSTGSNKSQHYYTQVSLISLSFTYVYHIGCSHSHNPEQVIPQKKQTWSFCVNERRNLLEYRVCANKLWSEKGQSRDGIHLYYHHELRKPCLLSVIPYRFFWKQWPSQMLRVGSFVK